eukprot:PhM_4_TR14002/c0_g2_i1/m.13401
MGCKSTKFTLGDWRALNECLCDSMKRNKTLDQIDNIVAKFQEEDGAVLEEALARMSGLDNGGGASALEAFGKGVLDKHRGIVDPVEVSNSVLNSPGRGGGGGRAPTQNDVVKLLCLQVGAIVAHKLKGRGTLSKDGFADVPGSFSATDPFFSG